MKKIQMPIAFAVVLGVTVIVLAGALVYSMMRDGSDTAQQPAVQTAEAEINKEAVLVGLKSTKAELVTMSAAKSEYIKGSCLKQAAAELERVKTYCTDKEKNLKRFLSSLGTSFSETGDKLTGGGALDEADTNNLTELSGALDNAISIAERAAAEDNGGYLQGEFSLPAVQLTAAEPITREQAEEAARTVLDDAAFKEEKNYYYSFSADGYLLEVSKTDGSVMYRRTGYEIPDAMLTDQRLLVLAESAKTMLRDKGYGDMALMQWQANGGELAMSFYPVSGGTLYMNAPFNVVMDISEGGLLGLMTTAYSTINVTENEALLNTLRTGYPEHNYIVPAVNEYGVSCYVVSYIINDVEYISLWNIMTEHEIKLSKIENNFYGRLMYGL